MKTRTFALYSAGGFAREIASDLRASLNLRMMDDDVELIFIDDDPAAQGTLVQQNRVVSYEEAKSMPGLKVNVAFAPPALRRRKYEQCEKDGLEFFNAFATTSRIGENVELGNAAIFAHLSTVTADATIGKAFHCNIYSYVAHDCIVGDFVTFAPRVSLNGRIKVEDDVYVGSDATFLPGKPDKYLTIGKGAVIGAGAVVTKDVEPGAVVVGSPAKPLPAMHHG